MIEDIELKPLTTLIVDDEPLAIERLQLLCARQPEINLIGTASDGEAALRLTEQLKPDLLLLDVQGTDSIEGGEASKTFERQAALFVLGLADVLVVNVWEHDVGRHAPCGPRPTRSHMHAAHVRPIYGHGCTCRDACDLNLR